MYATNRGNIAIYGEYDDDFSANADGVPTGGLYYSVYDGLLRVCRL